MPETGQVGIIRGAPYFLVPDVSTACAYYQEVLGFRCDYSAGDPPEFALTLQPQWFRDHVPARYHPEPQPPNEKQGGTWDVFTTGLRTWTLSMRS